MAKSSGASARCAAAPSRTAVARLMKAAKGIHASPEVTEPSRIACRGLALTGRPSPAAPSFLKNDAPLAAGHVLNKTCGVYTSGRNRLNAGFDGACFLIQNASAVVCASGQSEFAAGTEPRKTRGPTLEDHRDSWGWSNCGTSSRTMTATAK